MFAQVSDDIYTLHKLWVYNFKQSCDMWCSADDAALCVYSKGINSKGVQTPRHAVLRIIYVYNI